MWRILEKLFDRKSPECEVSDRDIERARQAREQSEQDLQDVRNRRPEVERIAGRLREIRQRNHLAEMFERSIREKGDPDHA